MAKKSLLSRMLSAVSSAVLAVSMLTAAVPTVSAASFESAKTAVSSITVGWNLGNSLDSWNCSWLDPTDPLKYEKGWQEPNTTPELIKGVKAAGFNAIRVPVTWRDHIDDNGKIEKNWLARVKEVVDYVIAQDMYCILDVHHDGGDQGWIKASNENFEQNKKKFAGLWKNIANTFRDYDDKLIFEGFNEIIDENSYWNSPKDLVSYEAVTSYNQLFVDTVRATGGNNAVRNLMVQTYCGNGDEKSMKNFVVPTDSAKDHLIAHLHNYDPINFTFSSGKTDKWGTDAEKRSIDSFFTRADRYSNQWGIPVVVGEFGSEAKNNDDVRAEHAAYYVQKGKEVGIPCFWWDCGYFSIINRNNGSVSHKSIVSAMMSAAKTKQISSGSDSSSKTDNSGKTDSSSGNSSADTKPASTKVTAKAGKSSIKLTWDADSSAQAYRVYQYDPTTKKYVRIKTVKGTSATIKNLSAGSYKFKVVSVKKTNGKYVTVTKYGTVKVTVKK